MSEDTNAAPPSPPEDFEFGAPDRRDHLPPQAYQPLLKPSLVVAAIAFGTLFFASVARNNLVFGSPWERLLRGLVALATVVALLACISILVAYRLPVLSRGGWRGSLARWFSGYGALVRLNILGLLAIWLICSLQLAAALSIWMAYLLSGLTVLLAALAATVALWHSGMLRGYAVGALTALLLMLLGNINVLMLMRALNPLGGRSVGTTLDPYSQAMLDHFGMTLGLAQLAGLVSAGYVCLLERFQVREKDFGCGTDLAIEAYVGTPANPAAAVDGRNPAAAARVAESFDSVD